MSRLAMPRHRMMFLVMFLSGSSFAVQAQSQTEQTPVVSGQAVYERWCSHCHAPGPGHPGTQSLQIKYGGKLPATLLDRTDLSPEAVAMFVRQGVLMMAPYRKTEISDAELAALAAYVAQNFKSP